MKFLLFLALLLLIAWVLRRGGRRPPGDDWRRGGDKDPLPPAGPSGRVQRIDADTAPADETPARPKVTQEP